MAQIKFSSILLTEVMPKIRIEDVLKAYSGKPDTCMCGCAGTYSYPKLRQKEGGEDRGYPVNDNEINDKRIKTIFNKFYNEDGIKIEVIIGDDGEYVFTKVIGKTQYTLYVK